MITTRPHIFWRGASPFDGSPIYAVVTGIGYRASANRKTGPMAQVWVLPEGIHPVEAITTGQDRAVCGDCELRDGRCYVGWNALTGIARTDYPTIEGATWHQPTRWTAYGEGVCIPLPLFLRLWKPGDTGYTHAWRELWAQPYRPYLMASVHTESEARQAQAMGWRTYRTIPTGGALMDRETLCPWRKEKTGMLTCMSCRHCDGTHRNVRGSIGTLLTRGRGQKRRRSA